MVERVKDELLDHEYDGIREFDNPCPAWWHLIFIGSVVFSVFYFVFFHFGPNVGTNGWTVEESYEKAYSDNLQLQFAEIGELTVDEATILQFMKGPDPEAEDAKDWLAIGAVVFKTHCKSCHADNGQGLVGPNLTDENYKNVKQLIDIARVIENGAANGSMPAWKNRLVPNEIVLVSAYVANMRGQNLEGRKAEGDVIGPWPEEAAVPSAKEEGEEGDEDEGIPTDDQRPAEAESQDGRVQDNQENDKPASAKN
jgi:cytochrome c oxidase cbb3-type subunit 3